MAPYPCLLLLMSALLTTTTAKCYYSDGSSESNSEHVPCVAIEGRKSSCCATNRTKPSGGLWEVTNPPADLCMENGLCKSVAVYNENDTHVTKNRYFTSMCSSSEWPKGACINPCPNSPDLTPEMTPCDGADNSTEWCCSSNTTCCGTPDAVTIPTVLAALAPASSSLSPSSSSSPKSTSTSTSSSSSSHSLSSGAVAGIGVGAGIGTMAILGALGYLWMRHRKSAAGGLANKNMGTDNGAVGFNGAYHRKSVLPVEVDGSRTPPMLEGNAGDGLRHELGDGREYR